MIYQDIKQNNFSARVSMFDSGRREMHAIIEAEPQLPFKLQEKAINDAVAFLQENYRGLKPIYRRYFFSDIENQKDMMADRRSDSAVSMIQQPPLSRTKLVLWVIFQENSDFISICDGVWEDSRGNLIFEEIPNAMGDAYVATQRSLQFVADVLRQKGGSLLDNCVRTWFLVDDVDRNYTGVVEGRNDIFEAEGLNRDTHFIASTGIGGRPKDLDRVISFNAFCNLNLVPGQMWFLKGATHLNPTIEYGVAFERGTVVDYRDRRHVYISGTASIDNRGEILYPNDVRMQTERMLENIRVLLKEAECETHDVAHLIVYLRDIADYDVVLSIIEKQMFGVPSVYVYAPVCRPGWLVEAECIAIASKFSPEMPEF